MIALGGIAMLRDLLITRQGSRHRSYPVAVITYATQMVATICIEDNSRRNTQSMLDQNLMGRMLQNIQQFPKEELLLLHTAAALLLFSMHQVRVSVFNAIPATERTVEEASYEDVKIMIRALRLHFEDPKLCSLFCKILGNMGMAFRGNFNVMHEMGMCSYLVLALRYYMISHNVSLVGEICALLAVFLGNGESSSRISRACMMVRTGLADLRHVMLNFLDDDGIQIILNHGLMPILCKHRNVNSTQDMHAIVEYVLQCIRAHVHIHTTSTPIRDQTSTLAIGFQLLRNMIATNPEYSGIIRMHYGREILEFAQQIHRPFLLAEDDVQDAIAFVNGALSRSDPMTDFQ